jgi:hypothetical protein
MEACFMCTVVPVLKKYGLQFEEHLIFFVFLVLTLFGSGTWTGMFFDCWNIPATLW